MPTSAEDAFVCFGPLGSIAAVRKSIMPSLSYT